MSDFFAESEGLGFEKAASDNQEEIQIPNKKTVMARWHHQELFDGGFVGVPTRFLELYSRLKPSLTSGEALFVIHLMNFKWDEKEPFPSYKLLGERMGLSAKTVQRHAQALEAKKYLTRIQRIGESNKFDLTRLFDALLVAKSQFRREIKTKRRKNNG